MGLAATAAVVAIYAVGGLDWVELRTFDLRFRYANSIPEDARIVAIDIDDASLEKVGRWAWPRDVQAGVISILGELGAAAVLYDITLAETQPVRSILPRQADIAVDPLDLRPSDLPMAFPDLELQAAIADAGMVYLAFDYAADDVFRSVELRRVVEALEQGNTGLAERLAAALRRRSLPPGLEWAPLAWAQAIGALRAEPALDPEQLTARLGRSDAKRVSAVIEVCRRVAFGALIRAWLDAEPTRWHTPLRELLDPVYSELIDIDKGGEYREAVALALREVLSCQATTRTPLVPLAQVAAAAPPVDAISPVYFPHARAARRCGFVVFEPDLDGVVRRLPLLVQHEGRVLSQLAFGVAFDVLGLSPADVRAEPGRLTLRLPNRPEPLVIQLDRRGHALVPWVAGSDWKRQFGQHIPADAVWMVFDRRLLRAKNQAFLAETLGRLVSQGPLAAHQQYWDDLRQVVRLRSDLRRARYGGDPAEAQRIAAGLAEYRKLLADGEPPLRADLGREIARVAALPALEASAETRAQLDALRKTERAFAANDEYQQEIQLTLAWLRKRVAGKICVVGYTATSLPDMAPLPTSERAPGVVAHANLLNGLLTGRMVQWAPAWLNGLLAALLGILVTTMSVRWGPRAAGAVALLVLGYIALAGWLVFYASTYWIAITPAVGTLVGSYVIVAVFRYAFLDRERRQLTTALSQYTSATLARQMAEDAELCRRAEMREVTAVFTDLANFTPISERIGAERTQRVLNLSLGRFSDVMLHHEAMVNKFIGDGIFAFWNPVIYPQADHALRACETAVDLQIALRELIAEERRAGGDEVFGELVLRVGVATGNAVVGPCGSEQKYDYTCIGDSVNVASRLESANKFYGTRTLVSGTTRQQVGERFAFRSLGGVQVKGKTQAVPIFELLGRMGEVAEDVLRHAERFAEGVAAFQQRAWADAGAVFDACVRQRPDDRAAQAYTDAVRRYLAEPPGDDWNAALELTEK